MLTETQIRFLKEKIQDLRSALLYSMSDALLKLPTTIITALNVDDDGQVWFLINRPSQYLDELEQEFPVRLDFFKKGKDFFLKLSGKAAVIQDANEADHFFHMTSDMKSTAVSQMLLVKVRVQHVDCIRRGGPSGYNLLGSLSSFIKNFSGRFKEDPYRNITTKGYC